MEAREKISAYNEKLIKGSIQFSKRLNTSTQAIKWLVAAALLYGYFTGVSWMTELLLWGVVISLLIPMSFFGGLIKHEFDYKLMAIEERQELNANEANFHFAKMNERIEALEFKLENQDID